MRIFKYVLNVHGDPQQIDDMPFGARVLHVANQNGALCLWAEVNDNNSPEPRRFRIYGTGHDIRDGETYVGTALVPPYVWHVYEVPL